MSKTLEMLSTLERIEKNVTTLSNRLADTQQALRETLPYAEEHWHHNPEMIKRWRTLAGL